MNNTTKHISDQASSVDFQPSGTDWPATIVNVQTALAEIGSWCHKSTGLPVATAAKPGIISLATAAEARAGTDEFKAITPFTLNDVLKKPEASETVLGTTQYANTSERLNASINNRTITPKGLDDVFNRRTATEALSGAAKVATGAQAAAGTDDNVMMTPKKVKIAIDSLVPRTATATESVQGTVRLATTQEIQAGVAREGIAISPYGFANARGTGAAYGTFKAATGTDIISGTAMDKAVTPKSLFEAKGSVSNFGIVALSTSVGPNAPNHALAANAAVLPTTGGIMTGNIQYNTTGSGLRWDFNTDHAYITFHSTGDGDPDTRMEFVVGDNYTEYFTWKAYGAGGMREIMRATPNQQLFVNNGIFDRGHLVYSPVNPPSPESIGAIRNQWGAVQMTGDLNWMDGPIDYALPPGYVQVGMWSWHSNNTEDRVWRMYYRYLG